ARLYLVLVAGQEPSLPSFSGLLVLAGYPLIVVGLLRFARGQASRLSQALLVLDIVLTAVAAGVFADHFVLDAQIKQLPRARAALYQVEKRRLAGLAGAAAPAVPAEPAEVRAPGALWRLASRALNLVQIVLPFLGPLLIAGLLLYDTSLPPNRRDPSLAWGL